MDYRRSGRPIQRPARHPRLVTTPSCQLGAVARAAGVSAGSPVPNFGYGFQTGIICWTFTSSMSKHTYMPGGCQAADPQRQVPIVKPAGGASRRRGARADDPVRGEPAVRCPTKAAARRLPSQSRGSVSVRIGRAMHSSGRARHDS